MISMRNCWLLKYFKGILEKKIIWICALKLLHIRLTDQPFCGESDITNFRWIFMHKNFMNEITVQIKYWCHAFVRSLFKNWEVIEVLFF